MCGRTACTLGPDKLSLATSYKARKDGDSCKFNKTKWINLSVGQTYKPSHSIAPTGCMPVLVSGHHASEPDHERVLVPMRWGLVPHFHKGPVKEMKLATFNARSEQFMEKPMFSTPFKQGNRCVVVCDGYYEWKKDGNARKPYFMHSDPEADWTMNDTNTLADENIWNDADGWKGRNLTMMAGIFDYHKSDETGTLYSFTILTQASSSRMEWIHNRMPVFLQTPDAVQGWLSCHTTTNGDTQSALSLITPHETITWHAVSPNINNVNHKQATFAPVQSTRAAAFMSSWLQKGDKKQIGNDSAKQKEGDKRQEESNADKCGKSETKEDDSQKGKKRPVTQEDGGDDEQRVKHNKQ